MKRLLFVATVTLASCALASAQTATFQGIGRSSNSNPVDARQEACESGIRIGVEKAADAAVPSPPDRAKLDDVLDGYRRYAKTTQILDEGSSYNGYRCRVAVTVDIHLLAEDLKEAGVSAARAIGPKVMVIIDEYHFDREPPITENSPQVKTELDVSASRKEELSAERSSARAAVISPYGAAGASAKSAAVHASDQSEFTLHFREYFPPAPPVSSGFALPEFVKALRERDYYVLDEQIAKQIRVTHIGVMADFMAKPTEIAKLAKELGANHNARWLVLGGVKVVGDDSANFRKVARASMMIQVVDTSTGETIAASEIPSKAVEETSQSSAMRVAAVKVTDSVVSDVLSQIATYENRRNALGQRLAVRVFSVSNARVVAELESLLKAISGVTEVAEANFDKMNGLLELDVAFQGKSEDLRNSILVASGNVASLKTLDLYQSSGGALDFAFKPSIKNVSGKQSNTGR